MIVFFDILLIDDDVCLRKPHRERRLLLKDAIRAIPGRADIAEQEIFDFSRPDSSHRLARSFAKRIAQRWEGYVLKGSDEPYFSIFSTGENGSVGRWIKLKKDYVPGLGDTVDLAIIGGRYDSRDAAAIGCKLSWTHFMIGCLINKEAMMHHKAKPKFRVVDMISRYSMSRQNLHVLNQFGQFSACPIDSDHGFEIENGPTNLPYMSMVFKSPFVVEMMGGGFEKPSGARYFTLRFPRVVKIHWDRTFEDAASFSELQLLAEAARSVPQEDMSQEENRWAKRLRLGNGSAQYIVDRSQSPVSTGSSSSCSETSSIPCTGDRAQPSNQAKSSTDAVPIYIDPEISRPSSAESDNRGFLTENENLSQHNRELHTKHSNDPTENASHTEKTKPHTLSPRTAKPTLKSPLPFIPIYLPDTPSQPLLTKSPQTITNLATFLKAFSQQTQSQPHKPNSTYALTCLNATQTELGPELLSLAKAVETRRNTPSFPCIGKIFILDSAFLYLNADPADTRFCLRETWAGIARRYFYACLGWSVGGIEIRFDGDELAELVSWDGV